MRSELRQVAAVVLVSLLTLLAGPALAAELEGTLKKIKRTNTITLGHRESSHPFSFVGDDGKPAGYSVDLCTPVAAASASPVSRRCAELVASIAVSYSGSPLMRYMAPTSGPTVFMESNHFSKIGATSPER